VRKVTNTQNGTRTKERIYLVGCEVYREYSASTSPSLERETLHVMGDKQRIAMVETRTLDTAGNDTTPQQLIRYQFGNHLGSTSLELDHHAQIITYEEYTPYGSTSYQAVRSQMETPKRYRYTGMERDEESGLNYHGARYSTSGFARWCSPEPLGIAGRADQYALVDNNPIKLVDLDGRIGTIALGLIGAAVGFAAGVGYGIYKGESIGTSLTYGAKGAVVLGGAGLTLGASIAATGTISAGVAAWGTKAIVGAGISSTRQTLEIKAGKRKEISSFEMAQAAVLSTAPIPASVAAPVAGLSGSIGIAQGARELGNKGGNDYEKALGVFDATLGLISYTAPFASTGSGKGPLIPALATDASVVHNVVASTEAGTANTLTPPPILNALAESAESEGTKTAVPSKPSVWERVDKLGEAVSKTRGGLVGKIEEHHIFPQTLTTYFENAGIDVDEYVVAIDQEIHKVGQGKGGFFENWNKTWKDWISKNPNATPEQIFEQAGKMMDDYGLSLGKPLKEYRK
jgi:RHS repeat-associated protein